MIWNFYINDVLVDEPIGWADIVLNIARDEQWHGIFLEASTSTFGFYGSGADILRGLKETSGLAATASLRIEAICGETIDVLEGNLDFGSYIEDCGTTCIVNISVEKTGCVMTLRNRYDQKVDLSYGKAFDKVTQLQDYAGLNFTMEVAPQRIKLGAQGSSEDGVITEIISDSMFWVPDSFDDFVGYISPAITVIDNDSFGAFNNSPLIEVTNEGANNIPPYPDFPTTVGTASIVGDIVCELVDTTADFRLKGNATIVYSGTPALVILRLKLWRLPVGLDGTIFSNWVQEYENEFYNVLGSGNVDFDISATVPLTITQGDFFYYGIGVIANDISDIGSFTLRQDPESFFKLESASVCEATDVTASLVNEVGSRIVESITDGCMKMRSDYFGRTDSQPYASDADGCGSLRVLTSGLRLRNAENPVHFMSLRDYFIGLRGIDNIGMGVEGTDLIIEPVEYFYQNVQVLQFDGIPNAKFFLDSKYGFSLVKIGYTKWEIENINGLDEFNSNKEFRTSLSTIDNTLDALSPFVAGGYPIEITRQQSFATSGGADTTYDNDNFIICVERNAYGYQAEQGNIIDASNFYSPTTAYNWRIRPYYNLMRWWKSIATVYTNFANTTSKLFFSAGTGNLLASGELPLYDPCKLEVDERPENDDLDITDFAVENIPIWQPERVTFTYPLSLADYNNLKDNPYGYINLQCGNGDYVKAYVLAINYRPAAGSADFNLLLKWA